MKKIIFTLLIIFFSLSIINVAEAQVCDPPCDTGEICVGEICIIESITPANQTRDSLIEKLNTTATRSGYRYSSPIEITMNIINAILGLIGLFFMVMIIYSGFQWMTSGGNEETITKARKRLTNSIIGLGIILLSWVIANALMLLFQGLPLSNWWE